MSVQEAILQQVGALPAEKQEEVLRFATSLVDAARPKAPLKDPEGMLAHLNFRITEEDIAEARREMWKNFPREDIA